MIHFTSLRMPELSTLVGHATREAKEDGLSSITIK
jgi:hypothetical protein